MSLNEILLKNNIDEETCEKFHRYYELLIDWNKKINLTAITEEDDVALKHFIDSLNSNSRNLIKDGMNIIDIGTGAGFPGLPLKINQPSINLTLVDSLNKRITFLNNVINELKLKNVITIHSRAEDLGNNKDFREKFDICVSRAVANLATLSELCLPFVKCGGYFISLKGPKAPEELENAKNAISLLGGKICGIDNYNISDTELNHNVIIIKKVSQTPTKYPRKAPKPVKEPL